MTPVNASPNSYLLSYSALHVHFHLKVFFAKKSTLIVSKCPLSVLESGTCISYRELSYSRMTEKWQKPTPEVNLTKL